MEEGIKTNTKIACNNSNHQKTKESKSFRKLKNLHRNHVRNASYLSEWNQMTIAKLLFMFNPNIQWWS